MSECESIVCERDDRWATALRVMSTRQGNSAVRMPRLYEVRSLDELAARLEARPSSVALISVHDANLQHVLPWLATASGNYPQARFVGLIGCCAGRREIADWLLEAGAADIADSPRRLQHIVQLVQRHAQAAACRHTVAADDSLAESVWSSLPWQIEQRQLR